MNLPESHIFTNQPKRHPLCDKLKCYYNTHYRGLEVNQHPGWPLIEQYLERTYETLMKAVIRYPRVLVFRIDLRFPDAMPWNAMHENNQVLSQFFKHFQDELHWAGTKYTTELRYVWAREQCGSEKPHYHILFLLNYNAFNSLGSFEQGSPEGIFTRENLYHRIVRAWAKAMDWPLEAMQGLPHAAKHPVTCEYTQCLGAHDFMTLEDVMFAASYLCKAYTKPFAQGVHVFGTSRI